MLIHCPECGARLQGHTRIGIVAECPRLRSPAYYTIHNHTGALSAVVVGSDLLASTVRLFEPELARELGFQAPHDGTL